MKFALCVVVGIRYQWSEINIIMKIRIFIATCIVVNFISN